MSSLQDPFDLIKTDKDMDNVVPFLAQNKINQMIDTALAHQQLPKKKSWNWLSTKTAWSGGLATAACIALLMTFFSPTQPPVSQTASSQFASDDVAEFSELVMLDTLDKY